MNVEKELLDDQNIKTFKDMCYDYSKYCVEGEAWFVWGGTYVISQSQDKKSFTIKDTKDGFIQTLKEGYAAIINSSRTDIEIREVKWINSVREKVVRDAVELRTFKEYFYRPKTDTPVSTI